MFRGLMAIEDMSVVEDLSMSSIYKLTARPDFPKPVRSIGSVKFYDCKVVRAYFENRRGNLKRRPRL